MTTADCDKINTAIVRESGRISPEINQRVVLSTPWVALTPRAPLLDEMGIVQTTSTFERMLPGDVGETWADVAPSDNSQNQCLPPVEVIKWGQTLRTWRLQKIAKQTDEFCIEDLRTAFQLQKVLQMYTDGLTTVSREVWENRDRNEYIRTALYKITEAANGIYNIGATSFDAAHPPTSRLTWGTLKQIRAMLVREGAGVAANVGMNGKGAPVYGLMTDEQTQDWLIHDDPQAKDDFRFAYEGAGENSPLLKAPFALESFSYNGYKFMTDFFPQRFEITGGQYVRVQPFKDAEATTSGFKRELNPAYIYATYQVTVVHVPNVFTQRVPKPLANPGGRFKFDPVNYMGDFQWKNILHKVCNPDGTIGFFRAVFASASEPVHPEYGYAIMHLNCPALRNLQTSCYS